MFRAKLDSDQVYWGVEIVEELGTNDVVVPEDCDLRPGHYWWDGEKFMPLAREAKRDAPEAPALDRALFEMINNTPDAPAYCKELAAWYATTMDARGKR